MLGLEPQRAEVKVWYHSISMLLTSVPFFGVSPASSKPIIC